jgi:hypothetical protein
MGKQKRFNYNIVDVIIGLDFEKAKEICYFNGYLLANDLGNISENSFYNIGYELRDNRINKVYFNFKKV